MPSKHPIYTVQWFGGPFPQRTLSPSDLLEHDAIVCYIKTALLPVRRILSGICYVINRGPRYVVKDPLQVGSFSTTFIQEICNLPARYESERTEFEGLECR